MNLSVFLRFWVVTTAYLGHVSAEPADLGLQTIGSNGVPSNCVWAILMCCMPADTTAPLACFESRGCPGPFLDRSPCDSRMKEAAYKLYLKTNNVTSLG